MRTSELSPGLEVAARDGTGAWEKAVVKAVNDQGTHSHVLMFVTGYNKGEHHRVTSRSIQCAWEQYAPVHTKRRRELIQHEFKKAQAKVEQDEKIQRLEVIRETLKLFDIPAGIGNVFVPAKKEYDPTIFIRHEHAEVLQRILTDYASLKLTATQPTNDS